MVSFIVIGRNEGWRLEKCFKGIYVFVEAEKIVDYEVIYVDSKSTDGSVELSKRFNNTKTLLITGECNAAIARNIGAKEASGDILFFLDGDMELIPGFWSSVVKDGRMVYPFVSGIENDLMHDGEWHYQYTRVRRKFKVGIDKFEVTTGGLFMIEASLWKRVGGMDNRFKRCQDLDFGFRLTNKGVKLCRKPLKWVNHYTRDYEVRKDQSSFFKYTAMLLRKHFFNIPAQRFLIGPNYTMWMMLLSIVLLLVFKSVWPIFLYLVPILYRTFRAYQRNRKLVNPIITFIKLIAFDIEFIFYFLFYWPKKQELEYKVV